MKRTTGAFYGPHPWEDYYADTLMGGWDATYRIEYDSPPPSATSLDWMNKFQLIIQTSAIENDETGFINLKTPPGPPRRIRTEEAIKKVKQKLQQSKVSSRKLALKLCMSRRSAEQILQDDLRCRPYN